MFENVFSKALTILHPNGNIISTHAIVTREEFKKIDDGYVADVISTSAFIIDGRLDVNIYDKIKYQNQIFEIKSISLIENIDGSKVFFKIKVI